MHKTERLPAVETPSSLVRFGVASIPRVKRGWSTYPATLHMFDALVLFDVNAIFGNKTAVYWLFQ